VVNREKNGDRNVRESKVVNPSEMLAIEDGFVGGMKARKLWLIALILTIPVLVFLLAMWLNPSKPSDELTEREAIGLTNAVRIVSTKPIIRIGFSDVDNRAFVQTGFVTNKNDGHVQRDGYVFELRSLGWKLVAKPIGAFNF
jgi:hypothetical protein